MRSAALPVLRTPRLTLRPLGSDDAPALARGVGNYDVSRWLAVVPYPYDLDHARHFVAEVARLEKPIWGIADEDGLQGVIGLDEELGYWLARPFWRRGYAFEAARAVVAHWFSDPRAGDLPSSYFHGNDRSGAVLSALGFVVAGHRKRYARSLSQEVDTTDMILTRAAWEARQDFTIFTPRLTLRPMTPADAATLAQLATPELSRGTGSMVTGWSVDEARAWIEARRWAGLPGFQLAIERDGRMIGGVGIGGDPVAAGYFVATEVWGQGIATEAMSAFLPEVFRRFPLNTIHATRFEDNPASGRVLAKLGFVETGRGMGGSKARLEPAPIITYRVTRDSLKVPV